MNTLRLENINRKAPYLVHEVDFFVRSSLPPVEGIFYDGQIFDAYAHIISSHNSNSSTSSIITSSIHLLL